MRPPKYVLMVTSSLDGSMAREGVGNELEPARAFLARRADALTDADPELIASPDPVYFMDRPQARVINLLRGEKLEVTLMLADATPHCRSCRCYSVDVSHAVV
jgi:hypothetical protein